MKEVYIENTLIGYVNKEYRNEYMKMDLIDILTLKNSIHTIRDVRKEPNIKSCYIIINK